MSIGTKLSRQIETDGEILMAIEDYSRNRDRRDMRVVVLLNTVELEEIDQWGAKQKCRAGIWRFGT